MTAPASARLDALSRDHRDWAPFVAVVRETAAALVTGVDHPGDSNHRGDRNHPGRALAASVECRLGRPDADAPLLRRASITVDARALHAWLVHLMRLAAGHGAAVPLGSPAGWRALDAVALAQATLDHDVARIADLGEAADIDGAALGAVAHLAVTPVLDACRRAHRSAVPPHWPRGSCPVCGGWATLAEARGLDRSLRLRCARCAADWPGAWLACALCGNRDHERLGSLVPDGVGETRRVETCEACRGYLKTITTLTALAAGDVALEDLGSIDLDLVALERGYRKPPAPAALGAHLGVSRRASWLAAGAMRRRA